MYQTLKPEKDEDDITLNINVIFVNVINGDKIANLFKKFGIVQIFTFKQPQYMVKDGIISQETGEVMRAFTIQMIKRLVEEKTFYQAF